MKRVLVTVLVGVFLALTMVSLAVAQAEYILNARDFSGIQVTGSHTDHQEWFTWASWDPVGPQHYAEVETYEEAGCVIVSTALGRCDIFPEVYIVANVPSASYRLWIYGYDEYYRRALETTVGSDVPVQTIGTGFAWRDVGIHTVGEDTIIKVKAVGICCDQGQGYAQRRGHFVCIFLTTGTSAPNFIPDGQTTLDIEATVDINPNVINLKSKAKWVTAFVGLPNGYDVGDIDISTVKLNSVVLAEEWPWAIGDHDGDGIADLMMKFDKAATQDTFPHDAETAEVVITGRLAGGTRFEGSDTVRVK